MLNEDYKNAAIAELEKANSEYMAVFKNAVNQMTRLLQSRQNAVRTIKNVEAYIMELANKPREYEMMIGNIKLCYIEFNNRIDEIKRLNCEEQDLKDKRRIQRGVMIGAGGAAFAPSAAMAIAMTFGTASTGTAISTLSGVAATNAALAWLGGGAVAVGGAGMAGGQLLLNLAGPIGWAIGGVSIAGSILMKAVNNKNIAIKAENAAKVIICEKERIRKIDATVNMWNGETIKLSNEIQKKLLLLRRNKDYSRFTSNDKNELIIMMNMTELLSKKIGDEIK